MQDVLIVAILGWALLVNYWEERGFGQRLGFGTKVGALFASSPTGPTKKATLPCRLICVDSRTRLLRKLHHEFCCVGSPPFAVVPHPAGLFLP